MTRQTRWSYCVRAQIDAPANFVAEKLKELAKTAAETGEWSSVSGSGVEAGKPGGPGRVANPIQTSVFRLEISFGSFYFPLKNRCELLRLTELLFSNKNKSLEKERIAQLERGVHFAYIGSLQANRFLLSN